MAYLGIQNHKVQREKLIPHPTIKKIEKILWAAFLLSLPITSFPYFPGFFGDTAQVRPLALYPLILLIFFVTIPSFLKNKLPKTLIPFIVFLLLALVSTIFSFSRGIPQTINVSPDSRMIRTVTTLGLGALIYFTVSLFPRDRDDLRFTVKWLYIGFAIALLWASFQIIYVIKFDQDYFSFLNEIQGFISTRRLFDKRISGMTYEPSWFAEQITFILMPMTFASVVSNKSFFRWRYSRLTIESLLLGWSFFTLLFTFSRTGLAVFVSLVLVSLVGWFWNRNQGKEMNFKKILRVFIVVVVVLLVLAVIVFVVAQKNNYFSRLWSYWIDEESEGTYFYYIAFSQRFTYWETAYQIFKDYPLNGIGLGNYAFYFQEYLPDRPYRNPELIMKLVPEKGRNQVVTVKNFGIRLLTETGIFGAAAFLSFLVALVGCVIFLMSSNDLESTYFGFAGLLGLIAFIPISFSIDSFAIPNMWVIFGLITSSTFVLTRKDEKTLGESI